MAELDLEELGSLEALMHPDEKRKIAELAALVPPEREIVELGSWTGGSSRYLAAGSKSGGGAHITCIGAWSGEPGVAQALRGLTRVTGQLETFLDVVDWQRVTALRGRSGDVAKMWLKPIGLLFIDADHRYLSVRADYEAWSSFVAPGGFIALHDYSELPGIYPEHHEAGADGQTPWTLGPGRVVNEMAIPSGLWIDQEVTRTLWTARRA